MMKSKTFGLVLPNSLLIGLLLCGLSLKTVVEGLTSVQKKKLNFTENDIVNTKKNPLIRLTISLKQKDLGQAAELGDACNQNLYDTELRSLYNGSLTIFEASDRLLLWLQRLYEATQENSTNTLRKDTCGSNHLMGCIGGTCQCLGSASADSQFPVYATMQPVEFVDPNDPSVRFTECRVTEGGRCNVRGHLFCDSQTRCVNDHDSVTAEPDPDAMNESHGNRQILSHSSRCVCKKFDPTQMTMYVENGNEGKHGIEVIKIPMDDCYAKLMRRPRAYQ